MNKTTIIAANIIAISALAHAADQDPNPSRSCVRIHVVNDAKEPLSGQKVEAWNDILGEHNNETTDSNGYAMLDVRRRMTAITLDHGPAAKAELYKKYYRPGSLNVSQLFTHEDIALSRWEPWGAEVEFVVNRIKNPVPMTIVDDNTREGTNRLYFPGEPGAEIGFDLVAGDWIPPYGKGQEVDFHCTLLTKKNDPYWSIGEVITESLGRDYLNKTYPHSSHILKKTEKPLTMKIRFARPGDGIQFKPMQFGTGEGGGSALYHPHEAPESGYVAELIIDARDEYRRKPINGMELTPIFRIRSSKNGGIYGVGGAFKFYYKKVYSRLPGGKTSPAEDRIRFDLSCKYNSTSRSLEWNGVDARTGKPVRPNWRENQHP